MLMLTCILRDSTCYGAGKSQSIEMNDVEAGTVELLLQFIYGCLHQPDLTMPEVAALFQASDKYALASLHRQCTRLLMSHVSYDNILQLADLAQLHQCPSLLQVSHADVQVYAYVCILLYALWGVYMCMVHSGVLNSCAWYAYLSISSAANDAACAESSVLAE